MSLAGGTLSHYEVLGELSRGGMGIVYRARDPRLRRDVALKVLPPALVADPERKRRFLLEARAAAQIDHPNVGVIHEVGEAEGQTFIAMGLIGGERLSEELARGALPLERALDLAIGIADGLAKAHAKGIVHRDLKPANIMIDEDGRPRIIDFGLAKLVEPLGAGTDSETATQEREEHTRPGAVMGTVAYMSPEQARGWPVDERSDIFSFGIVLYEMLTGRLPFHGPSSAETLGAIINAPTPRLPASETGSAAALELVLDKCLKKERGDRYQSMDAVAEGLRLARSAAVGGASGGWRPSRRSGWRLAAWAAGVAALVVSAVLLTRSDPGPPPTVDRIDSVAILPLRNVSGDPEQEYFADGMTESLIHDLGQVSALRVISRTSAMALKDAATPLPEIAERLGVAAVLEGSIALAGDRVRITARLVDARADRQLWSGRYERELHDVFALQGELARAIATEVRAAVTPEEAARLARSRTVNPEAHRLTLLGRHELRRRTAEGFQRALAYFEEAVEIDPTHAPAHAGLADTYSMLGSYAYAVMPAPEANTRARAAANRALEIDPTLAEAHHTLAYVAFSSREWARAEAGFRRALQFDPGNADIHKDYAIYLACVGRHDEALPHIERAVELDPLAPIILQNLKVVHEFARRFDEAVEIAETQLETFPDFPMGHVGLCIAHFGDGSYDEAIAACERFLEIVGRSNHWGLAFLGASYAAGGQPGKARRVLDELLRLREEREVPASEIAFVYARLGDLDEAFAWLERAYAAGDELLYGLKEYPQWDPLRSDPRFDDLLRRLGFPGLDDGAAEGAHEPDPRRDARAAGAGEPARRDGPFVATAPRARVAGGTRPRRVRSLR